MKKVSICFILIIITVLSMTSCVKVSKIASASLPAVDTAARVETTEGPSVSEGTDFIKPVTLTEHESQYVSVFFDGEMLAFDYNTSHKGVIVWLEEYTFGVDKGKEYYTDNEGNNGTIVFGVNNRSGLEERPTVYLYAGNTYSESSETSGECPELKGMSGTVNGITEETSFTDGDILLGYMICSKGEDTPWISDAFIKDYKSNLGKLKDIDSAFLLMCRSTDKTNDSDTFNLQHE